MSPYLEIAAFYTQSYYRTVIGKVPGLFVPWTIRTLDCSYRGLFVPSWTVRTMDYLYHYWTIRTMLQD